MSQPSLMAPEPLYKDLTPPARLELPSHPVSRPTAGTGRALGSDPMAAHASCLAWRKTGLPEPKYGEHTPEQEALFSWALCQWSNLGTAGLPSQHSRALVSLETPSP